MIYRVILFASAWTAVFGQFKDGITFGESAPPSPPPPVVANSVSARGPGGIIVVSPPGNCQCKTSCVPGTPAPPGIDIRIVNNGPSPIGCPAGQILCCESPNPPPENKCGLRKIDSAVQPVVGQASFGAYPWHAALLDLNKNFLGSGVLLEPSYVLTAAHKVAAFVNNPAGLIVRLGEWDGQSVAETIKYEQAGVVKITLHPQFNPANLENDVAIIRLSGNMPVADHKNINTACRPALPPTIGKRCFVSGWGKNLFDGSYQKVMREVDVPIMDPDECERKLRTTRLGANFVLQKNSFMCAGGEIGKDACTGDGGAPLVCEANTKQWHVVGLVAWGIGCGSNGIPGVYTNVYNFLPWINQVISGQ